MRLDSHSERLVRYMEDALDRFQAEEIGLRELSATASSIAGAFERSQVPAVITAMERFVRNLENIADLSPAEEQPEKVQREIATLRVVLAAAKSGK